MKQQHRILRARAAILRQLRAFFDDRKYCAVETPQLARFPIPEQHIELFGTEFLGPAGEAGVSGEPEEDRRLYLLPSPEYHLKQLLAQGMGNIYEITHSFRNAESRGPQHNPEFTMLEYYTVDADGTESLDITRDLLAHLGEQTPPLEISMQEAWHNWTGIDLAGTIDPDATVDGDQLSPVLLAEEARRRDLLVHIDPRATWEDLFQRVFLSYVEPNIPRDRPVFVTGYPAAIPTLARRVPDTPWADRWELYLGGMEVANCFGEETDPRRIRAFMEHQAAEKERFCRATHPRDGGFLQPPHRLPRCSGVALGVDRLVMHLLGEDMINRVISFPFFL